MIKFLKKLLISIQKKIRSKIKLISIFSFLIFVFFPLSLFSFFYYNKINKLEEVESEEVIVEKIELDELIEHKSYFFKDFFGSQIIYLFNKNKKSKEYFKFLNSFNEKEKNEKLLKEEILNNKFIYIFDLRYSFFFKNEWFSKNGESFESLLRSKIRTLLIKNEEFLLLLEDFDQLIDLFIKNFLDIFLKNLINSKEISNSRKIEIFFEFREYTIKWNQFVLELFNSIVYFQKKNSVILNSFKKKSLTLSKLDKDLNLDILLKISENLNSDSYSESIRVNDIIEEMIKLQKINILENYDKNYIDSQLDFINKEYFRFNFNEDYIFSDININNLELQDALQLFLNPPRNFSKYSLDMKINISNEGVINSEEKLFNFNNKGNYINVEQVLLLNIPYEDYSEAFIIDENSTINSKKFKLKDSFGLFLSSKAVGDGNCFMNSILENKFFLRHLETEERKKLSLILRGNFFFKGIKSLTSDLLEINNDNAREKIKLEIDDKKSIEEYFLKRLSLFLDISENNKHTDVEQIEVISTFFPNSKFLIFYERPEAYDDSESIWTKAWLDKKEKENWTGWGSNLEYEKLYRRYDDRPIVINNDNSPDSIYEELYFKFSEEHYDPLFRIF